MTLRVTTSLRHTSTVTSSVTERPRCHTSSRDLSSGYGPVHEMEEAAQALAADWLQLLAHQMKMMQVANTARLRPAFSPSARVGARRATATPYYEVADER